ncbi:sulfurtransferase complex subunit TusC [Aliikangiella sp. G2MR2-5]|uniref:sulfurtransferase complex subunit TusC n=1 Tax=Aliikangiella sp. G2MR2-5 TaxID=2788943 RepID=UPI0018AA28DA|nr:sulfurtransferase complex subunit TusC [Aliikangiella sp. G2MR2-5]
MNNSITTSIIIQSPPFSSIAGKEAVDLALVCAAFEQQVNLIFSDRGVLHLLNNQGKEGINDKLHDKQLNALAFYDIDTIYVNQQSLKELNLDESQLLKECTIAPAEQINSLVQASQNTVTF